MCNITYIYIYIYIYIHTIYCLQQFLNDLKISTGVHHLGVMEQLLISDVVNVEVHT